MGDVQVRWHIDINRSLGNCVSKFVVQRVEFSNLPHNVCVPNVVDDLFDVFSLMIDTIQVDCVYIPKISQGFHTHLRLHCQAMRSGTERKCMCYVMLFIQYATQCNVCTFK